MDIKETFANKLRELRTIKKLSQVELAEALGVSRGSISFYENGERTADIDFVYKAAQFFNVSADYLIGRTNASTQNEDIRAICDYTGLSEAAVSELHNTKDFVDSCNDERAIIDEALREYVGSRENALDIVNLFIEAHMSQLGRHLYKYKSGIAEAIEEHNSDIKRWGSLGARIKANEKAPRYTKRSPFVTVKPEYWEKRDNNEKERLAKYELYEAADDFKSLFRELASKEERALDEVKDEYKKLEEAEEAALVDGLKHSAEEAKDSGHNGNDN